MPNIAEIRVLSSLKKITAFVLIFSVLSQTSMATTYTVTVATDTAQGVDGVDCQADIPGNPNCTLRAALSQAGAQHVDANIINVASSNRAAISLVPNNGPLLVNSPVTINGNGRAISGGGVTKIFNIDSGGSGSTIDGFDSSQYSPDPEGGIAGRLYGALTGIYVNGATDVTISNNNIGCVSSPCSDGNQDGVYVNDADNLSLYNNTISGNSVWGVILSGSKGDMVVSGNKIGVDPTGQIDVGNGQSEIAPGGGLLVSGEIDNLTISGNTISGNHGPGIKFFSTHDSFGQPSVFTGMDFYGNKIGMNSTGDSLTMIPNDEEGILFDIDVNPVPADMGVIQIGNSAQDPNIISGNLGDGIYFGTADASTALYGTIKVQNNYIGAGSNGILAGNTGNGIGVSQIGSAFPFDVIIGSDEEGSDGESEGNVISSNQDSGILIQNFGNSVLIAHNMIGVEENGTFAANNTEGAISINGDQVSSGMISIISNVIGAIPSENGPASIVVEGVADVDIPVVIQGNFIGLGLDGRADIGGGSGVGVFDGILILGGINNLYANGNNGGEGLSDEEFKAQAFDIIGQGNVISNMANGGICVGNCSGGATDISDAYIYGNIFGLKRGEEVDGVGGQFDTNAPNSSVNIIVNSDNLDDVEIGAVDFSHLTPTSYVGSDGFVDSSQLRNVIAGFDGAADWTGILINEVCDEGDGSCGEVTLVNIVNNYIGAGIDASGNQMTIPDAGDFEVRGIVIKDGDQINIGCRQTGSGVFDTCPDDGVGSYSYKNVISGNDGIGIDVFSEINPGDTPGVVRILGNYIGTNEQGTLAIPNGVGIKISRAMYAYIGYIGDEEDLDAANVVNSADVQYVRNIISGNNNAGILLFPADDVVPHFVVDIIGNYIGVDLNGGSYVEGFPGDIPNGAENIMIYTPFGEFPGGGIVIADFNGKNEEINIGGGMGIPERTNVISGNYGAGIGIMSAKAGVYNILGNIIGLDHNVYASDAVSNKSPSNYPQDLPSYTYPVENLPDGFWGVGILLRSSEYESHVGEIRNVNIDGNFIANNEGGEIGIVNNGTADTSVQYWTDGHIVNNTLGLDMDGESALNEFSTESDAMNVQNETSGLSGLITGLFDSGVIADNTINGGITFSNVGVVTDEQIGVLYAANTWYDVLSKTWLGYSVGGFSYLQMLLHVTVLTFEGDSFEVANSRPTGTQCSDSVDNDVDGLTDLYDSDCSSISDDSEAPAVAEVCTSFTYTEWGSCSSGTHTRTRTVVAAIPDGCDGGEEPVVSESCSSGGSAILISLPPVIPPVIPPPEITCPAGTVKQGNSCVAIPKTCPSGHILQGDNCIAVEVKKEKPGEKPVEKKTEEITKAANTVTNYVSTSSGTSNGGDGGGVVITPEEIAKRRSDCTTTEGSTDLNSNGIPDCLEPPLTTETSTTEPQTTQQKKEMADEIVFGLTGTEPAKPTIVSLDGKILDQRPLILVTGKPNTEVSLMIEEADTGKRLVVRNEIQQDPVTGKTSFEKVTTTEDTKTKYTDNQIEIGKTMIDKEYKGQISIENPLPIGKYYATLVSSTGMKSDRVAFEIAKTDMEIKELKVVEEKLSTDKVQPFAKTILSTIEKMDDSGRFVADEYANYKESRNKGRKYQIYAKLDSKDKAKKIVYFTYKSVIYSSVALSDVNEQGIESISVEIPEYVPKNEMHTLTMYVSDLGKTKISSKKSVPFKME